MPKLLKQPEWLRSTATSVGVGVDRENNRLNGFVVAQEGDFKSEGRGSFDLASLKKVVALMNKDKAGLKSRFTHPTLSSDGLGKFLGRAKNPRLDQVRVMRGGEQVLLNAVRADLHIDKTALDTPIGGGMPIGEYIMNLAESDPDALSSSLVLKADEEHRLHPKTRQPLTDDAGRPFPPIWRPTALHAADIVDTGDAVDGLLSAELSAEGLPDELVRRGCELLDGAFGGAERDVVESRLSAWVERYLSHRFGEPEVVSELKPGVALNIARAKVALAEAMEIVGEDKRKSFGFIPGRD